MAEIEINEKVTRKCIQCMQIKGIAEFFVNGEQTCTWLCISCKEINIVKLREKRRAHSKKRAPKQRQYRYSFREQILTAYGKECACCGETEPQFLALDHINNDGAAHRRELGIGAGNVFYAWAIKNNFPSNLQLLCHNCNMAKAFYGKCPHNK